MRRSSAITPSKPWILGTLMFCALLVIRGADVSAESCLQDQHQIYHGYGFDLSDQYDRWQEFQVDRPTVCRIDFLFDRNGAPSHMDVTIEDADGALIWNGTTSLLLPGLQWYTLPFAAELPLLPGKLYRVRLLGLEPSPDPDNRIFWLGQTESSYGSCVSDVEDAWPGYDYAFRIYTTGVVATESTSWGTVKARY